MSPQMTALVIFIAAYLLFIVFNEKRPYVAVGAVILLLITQTMSFKDALFAINWNVMGVFVGMLFVTDIFMESKVPAYLAEIIVNKAKNAAWAILFICMLSSFISAFVENVATVLIVAPVAFSLAKKLKINPINMMIAIAITSNLQGTATLIGDPPSMLLGGFAKMTFMDFFFYHGKPSIFFAVELGAIISLFVLYGIFKRHKAKVKIEVEEKVRSWGPTVILASLIVALALSSFFDTGFSYAAGILCMLFGAISLIWKQFMDKDTALNGIKNVDWETTIFLMGVFVIVGSITLTGWINVFSSFLSSLVGNNIFMGYTTLVFASVILSAFIDNVPFLATMLPVAIAMSAQLGINPSLFLFGLLIGASLGGNITPIGASANIVSIGLLRKKGYSVPFGDFVKIGLPFTIAAVIPAYLFVWLIWK